MEVGKKLRIWATALMLAAVMIAASACALDAADGISPMIGEVDVEDPTEYLECGAYVLELLRSEYAGTLPDALPSDAEAAYWYHYACALFGDPEFSIYLKLRYHDPDGYARERERIAEGAQLPDSGIFLVSGTDEDVEEYLDDQIFDGKSYNFEVVRFEEESLTVEYYAAKLWDGHDASGQRALLQSFFAE